MGIILSKKRKKKKISIIAIFKNENVTRYDRLTCYFIRRNQDECGK